MDINRKKTNKSGYYIKPVQKVSSKKVKNEKSPFAKQLDFYIKRNKDTGVD